MPSEPSIPTREFSARRSKVMRAIKNGVGVVFAGSGGGDLLGSWRPSPEFEYLTGITDEPDAVLVLDPNCPIETQREFLLLRPLDPEVERWDGKRDEISSALREQYGFKTIRRLGYLGIVARAAAARARKLSCLHQFAMFDKPVSPDLALFHKIAERIPGIEITDHTQVIPKLRSVKSKSEQACIRQACEITRIGFDDVLATMKPGASEFDVQETLEHAYRSNGSRGPAYNTIVGSGFNGTVLHYGANNQDLRKGDLVVIDSGANYRGYAADVTRTYPVGGKFSKRAREIYSIVLKALEASTKVAKAGRTFSQIDAAARKVITKAGYADRFIHGIGHHLGLEVHDATPDGPLKAGAVITIEPGIYIPEENIGVRIEDDILITNDTPVVLTKRIPKSIAAIEKAMASRKR